MRHVLIAGILLFAFTLAPVAAGADTPADAPAAHGPDQMSAKAHNENGFSLGVILGIPTGLTLRGGIGERNAIQAHFGYNAFPGGALVAMADWTYDAWNFIPNNPTAGLIFFFGFGAKIEWFTGNLYAYDYHGQHSFPDQSHFGVGARGLVGLRVPFHKAPFDIFFELAPVGVVVVIPDPGVYYDFGIGFGFRYRF